MKRLIAIFVTLAVACSLQAQNIKLPASTDVKKAEQSAKAQTGTVTGQANVGSLIGQLSGNISDDALTGALKKDKSEFISKANNAKDPAGASSALQSLEAGLLPAAMDAGWGTVKDKWIKDAKTANTVKSVASLTGTLESHISQKSFKGDWAKARPAWQTALNSLAK